MKSHLLLMALFAFFVSLVFAVIAKDERPRPGTAGRDDVRRLHAGGRRARLVHVSVSALTRPWHLRRSDAVERSGAVAIVTFNRPKVRNALNAETLDALRRTMLEL